jgi:5-methyltetrahydrofolate--homocysteine methyltransferase
MKGLEIANILSNTKTRDDFLHDLHDKQKAIRENKEPTKKQKKQKPKLVLNYDFTRRNTVNNKLQLLSPKLGDVWTYLNDNMLYNRHLGFKGIIKKKIKNNDPKATKLFQQVEKIKKEIIEKNIIKPKIVMQFLKVTTEGNKIIVSNKEQDKPSFFEFPRQLQDEGLSLSDFLYPDQEDTMGSFVITCGKDVEIAAEAYKAKGDFLSYQIMMSIAYETAEALAEYAHIEMRKQWGIEDPETITLSELFQAKYTGIRVSFGYPACPRMEDQATLWKLLDPVKNIGVDLTEGYFMTPEASVSALVFHHPQGQYFAVSENDTENFEKKIDRA